MREESKCSVPPQIRRDRRSREGEIAGVVLHGATNSANRWTLSSAFAGDLFRADRIATYESLIADMVVAYLRQGAESEPPARAHRAIAKK